MTPRAKVAGIVEDGEDLTEPFHRPVCQMRQAGGPVESKAMRPFLAIHDVSGLPVDEVEHALERVAVASHHAGVRPVETFYSPGRGRAYTYFEASDDAQVRDVCAAAQLGVVDVAETRRVFTELLLEARRDR